MKKPALQKKKTITSPDASTFMSAGELTVRLSKERVKGSPTRVTVWGPDDIGMEFETDDADKASQLFDAVPDGVTLTQLKALGFTKA